MKHRALGATLLYLASVVFAVFGFAFSLFPDQLFFASVGQQLGNASAVTDVRATYGGMSIGVGLAFYLLARNPAYVRVGLAALCVIMLCMAIARGLGMVLDGEPSSLMHTYLGLELLVALISAFMLRK